MGRRKPEHVNRQTSEAVALPLLLPLLRRCCDCYSERPCLKLRAALLCSVLGAHPRLCCSSVGCVGMWVCGLRVNGLWERGAPGTKQWHWRMDSALAELLACPLRNSTDKGFWAACSQLGFQFCPLKFLQPEAELKEGWQNSAAFCCLHPYKRI